MPTKKYYTDEERRAAYAAHQRNWRQANPEKSKEQDRRSYEKTRQHNRASRLLSGAKERAKQKGIEFNLDHSDIMIPEFCPVLGIRLERGSGNTRPELDRRDNSKGYVKGNVFVISGRANRLKADASVSELQALLRYMVP